MPENKTTLRLEIDKTIQPKTYEPIKIQVSVEESFYWENEKDRDKKMKEYRDRILNDFVKTFDSVVIRIGEEDRCIGRVLTSGKIPVQENLSSNEKKTDDEWDFS